MKRLTIIITLLMLISTAVFAQRSPRAVKIIKHYEGCALKAYKCPAGRTTIGYGNTSHAVLGKIITKEIADLYLAEDLKKFESYIDKTIPIDLPENKRSALVSASYNLGKFIKTDLKAQIISGSPNVPVRLRTFCNATVKGKKTKLRGLVKRRNTEATLYDKNYLDFE